MKRAISITITLLMLMSGMFGMVNESAGSDNSAGISSVPGNNVPLLTNHAPIRINNDTDFANQAAGEGWKGSGTATDPYVIENYDINGTNYGYCIYIGNTTVHFIVRNCSLHDASGNSGTYYWNSGMALYKVTGGILDNNTASNNGRGIYISYCDTSRITSNNVSSNNIDGMYLYYSSNNTIAHNNASSNSGDGIRLDQSSNNTVTSNNASSNGNGIFLFYSDNNMIENNSASSNQLRGIFFAYSSNNTLINNTASFNKGGSDLSTGNGIYLVFSTNNTILNNTASSNVQAGIFLDVSPNTIIINNNASNNMYEGIYLWRSYDSTIEENTASLNNEGIRLEYSENSRIENNTANSNQYFGIVIQYSGTCIVSNNTASSATYNSGIRLSYCSNSMIANNKALNNVYGIVIYSCNNSIIANNTASLNYQYGLLISHSSNSTIINNTASLNNEGIQLEQSGNNTITSNSIISNSIGIYANSANNNTITSNNITYNTNHGIALYSSSSNNITSNSFISNKIGIYTSSAINNTFYNNTIFNNTNHGIYFDSSSNNSIISNSITSNQQHGIVLIDSSSNNSIISNNISSNGYYGIYLYPGSNNTTIRLNSISYNNIYGIRMNYSFNNTITENNLSRNSYGIYLTSSSNNTIYHNNFINNTNQAYDDTGNNSWNASYPTGGNYWSDYNGTDNKSGPNQDQTGSDGIGDTPYTNISGGSGVQDSYPLMEPADFTPPEITISSPSDGAIFNTSSVTVYWNGSDSESGINHYEIRIDSGTWTDVGLNTSHTFTGLLDGSHTVYVKAINNAGNESTASVTFTVDTTPPAVVSALPTGTGVSVTEDVVVIFSKSMNTSVNPTLTQTNGTTVAYTFAGWSTTHVANDTATWNHTAWTNSETIGLTVSGAKDLAGNVQNPYSWSFTTEVPDTTPPSSSVSPISPYWQNSQLTLTLNATDDKELSNITLYYRFSTDNSSWSEWTQFGSPISASGTSWSETITFTSPDGDGYYEFYTIARDAAGNTEAKTQADAICGYDTASPEVTIDSPSDGAIFNITNVTVSWAGSDATSGIDHYEIRIDSGNWIDVGLNISCTFTGLSDDSYTAEVKVIDNAGNENSTSVTFTVDATAPEITINAPSEGSLHTGDVQITWHGSDATTEISQYEVKMDSDSWIPVGTNTTYHLENLTDGSYTFYVRAMDKAGNTAIAEVNFTVDATAPTITAHSPTGNDVPVDSVITVTFSEAMDKSTVNIEMNGVTGTITWNNNTATFTPSQNLSYDTKYTVYVTGSDPAGNAMNEYTWPFTTTDIGTITGTVTDTNGNPVEGATVTIDSGESATTDANGHFEIQAHAGNHTLTISKDGYEKETKSTSVTPGEETSLPPVELPKSKSPAGELPWLWVTLIIIIILVVVALLLKKKKSPGMPAEREETMEPIEETEETPVYGQAESSEEMAGEGEGYSISEED